MSEAIHLSHLGYQPVQKPPTIHVSSGLIWGTPRWFLGPIYGLGGGGKQGLTLGWYMERGLGQIVVTGAGEAMTP